MKTIWGASLLMLMLAALGAMLWIGGGQLGAWLGTWSGRLEQGQWLLVGFIIAVLAVMQSHRWSRRRASQDQVREVRRPVYESAAMAWQGALRAAGTSPVDYAAHLPRDLAALEDMLTMRASPAVLRDYQHLRDLARHPVQDMEQLQQQLMRLILRMRRELEVSGFVSLEEEGLRSFVAGGAGRLDTAESDPRSQTAPATVLPVGQASISLAGR